MIAILRRSLSLVAVTIFFSNLSVAVCPDSAHETSIAGYALSPDATRIAAIAKDGTVFWWDVASGKRTQLRECVQPKFFDHPIVFSPDSARLAVVVFGGIQVFDLLTGNVIARLTSLELKEIDGITFSGDGRRLAASYESGVVVWDIESQVAVASIPVRPSRNALSLTHDGALLALGGHNGVEFWVVPAKGPSQMRRLAEGTTVESVLFAHQDQWIVALTATPLPSQPKDRLRKYRREIAVWDSVSGKKLKSIEDAELEELPFGLTSGGPDRLLAADYNNHLRAWDLDSGELKATWATSTGHPSADGKLLLRESGAPGRLELWEIGGPDEKARVFIYKSPLCAESFADEKGNVKFMALFIADGISDNDQPFGSFTTQGFVAQDCTQVHVTWLIFKTEERSRQELEHRVGQAIEVLEKNDWRPLSLGERTVVRFPRRGKALGPFAVIWLKGTSIMEITSSSLPVALAMEKQVLEKEVVQNKN